MAGVTTHCPYDATTKECGKRRYRASRPAHTGISSWSMVRDGPKTRVTVQRPTTASGDSILYCVSAKLLVSSSVDYWSRVRRRSMQGQPQPDARRTRYCHIPCSDKCISVSGSVETRCPIERLPTKARCSRETAAETLEERRPSRSAERRAKTARSKSPSPLALQVPILLPVALLTNALE